MKRKAIILVCVAMLFTLCSAAVVGSSNISNFKRIGQYYKDAIQSTSTLNINDSNVAAEFGEYRLMMNVVEYERKVAALSENGTVETDREIAERLMTNHLLLLEAAELGIIVTQDEIDDFVDTAKRAYELPDGKAIIDDYCSGANITVDEYFDTVADQAKNIITRQKLKNHYGQEFCDENGFEFTNINPPDGMLEYIESQLDAIYQKYKNQVVYYID